MRRVIVASVLAALVAAGRGTPAIAADPEDPLARARALYNERQFEAAIAAAEEGRGIP